jgi:hypothetical protein
MWYRGGRPKWLGPIPYDYPGHLQGEAPGDYGFDILGLARNTTDFEKYFKYVPYFYIYHFVLSLFLQLYVGRARG